MSLGVTTESLKVKDEIKSPIIIESWKTRTLVLILFVFLSIIMFNVNMRAEKTMDYYIGAFASIGFIYMMFKLVLSFFYIPAKGEVKKDYRVSVVMPSYNENANSVVQSIECLLNQDYPLYEIIFVDDGSSDKSAYNAVFELSKRISSYDESVVRKHPKIIVRQFKENKGKKEAQLWGFKKSRGDIIMIADSDGYIFPNAVKEMLKPFNDDRVTSVVGHVSTRNTHDSFITRLQDILYHNAFRIGRAAQSITNSVIVCSGALSMHRRDVIVDHLDEFMKPKVLGFPCENGDDRRLTNISLKYGGRTKYQSTALCITDVPVKTDKFFRQQVRWAKSFYLQTIESLKHAWNKPFMLFWLLAEGVLWIVFGVTQTVSLINWSGNFFSIMLVFILGYLIISSFINGIYYVFKNPLLYLLAPVFSIAHMLIIFPVRIYALLTISKSGWGTR